MKPRKLKPIIWLLLLLLVPACRTQKECNIILINRRHPGELTAMLKEHEAATMDMLKTIADLEAETGRYQ